MIIDIHVNGQAIILRDDEFYGSVNINQLYTENGRYVYQFEIIDRFSDIDMHYCPLMRLRDRVSINVCYHKNVHVEPSDMSHENDSMYYCGISLVISLWPQLHDYGKLIVNMDIE